LICEDYHVVVLEAGWLLARLREKPGEIIAKIYFCTFIYDTEMSLRKKK
jgi:hypothetical protein